jgi:hypothetical protein
MKRFAKTAQVPQLSSPSATAPGSATTTTCSALQKQHKFLSVPDPTNNTRLFNNDMKHSTWTILRHQHQTLQQHRALGNNSVSIQTAYQAEHSMADG